MAYSLARFNTGGQHLAFWVLSQRFLPPVAIVLPLFLLYRGYGLYDTRFGLVLVYTVDDPAALGLDDVRLLPPVAAGTRGGGAGRRLHPLAGLLARWPLPLAVPGIAAAAVFAFIAVWTEFFFALNLTSRTPTRCRRCSAPSSASRAPSTARPARSP